MRIAGIGFRSDAPMEALAAALDICVGPPPEALATLDRKANAPQIRALALARGLRVHAIPAEALAAQTTLTQSAAQIARFGTGSLAEAAALAAAGPGARLIAARITDPSGQATAAIAISSKDAL